MTYLRVDTAAKISAAAAQTLKTNGVSFVGRYLVPPGMYKDLTADEIKILHDAGLAILPCWEIGAGDIRQGAERGAKDGRIRNTTTRAVTMTALIFESRM